MKSLGGGWEVGSPIQEVHTILNRVTDRDGAPTLVPSCRSRQVSNLHGAIWTITDLYPRTGLAEWTLQPRVDLTGHRRASAPHLSSAGGADFVRAVQNLGGNEECGN